MHKTNLGKCRTIFFDLEYYVPEELRLNDRLSYSPWERKCKLLGGSFLVTHGHAVDKSHPNVTKRKIVDLFIWEQDNEKALLEKVLELLISESNTVRKAHKNRKSAILCGVGITHSDIPVLFELFKRYHLLTNDQAFRLQNEFRTLDLSQLACCLNNNKTGFLYPETKNSIFNKYLDGKKFEKGSSVWELYEKKHFDLIKERVSDEVFSTFLCYSQLINKGRELQWTKNQYKRLMKKMGSEKVTTVA